MALPNIIQQINSKLPLSGGTFNNGASIGLGNDSNWKSIDIYSPDSGACLNLRGGNSSNQPYSFVICTSSNDSIPRKMLYGDNTGALIWAGNNVITSAGGNFNGAIHFKNGAYISRSFSNENTSGVSELAISALSNTSDPYTGASIYLHDINDTRGNTQGGFFIYARNTKAKECGLCGYTDGTLTWNNKNVVCVTYYRSGASWYRKYSDGFIEQGGNVTPSAAWTKISLITAFSNTNYQIIVSTTDPDTNGSINGVAWRDKTTSSFSSCSAYNGNFYSSVLNWYACGY